VKESGYAGDGIDRRGVVAGGGGIGKEAADAERRMRGRTGSGVENIPADDLLVLNMGEEKRVIIQLAPQFAPYTSRIFVAGAGWMVGGARVYRVQDNYVAQWGQGDREKPCRTESSNGPRHEYWRSLKGMTPRMLGSPDAYSTGAGFWRGWPVAYNRSRGWATLPHCYGYVGVARGSLRHRLGR
jgi:peptidylprolyl isomerase